MLKLFRRDFPKQDITFKKKKFSMIYFTFKSNPEKCKYLYPFKRFMVIITKYKFIAGFLFNFITMLSNYSKLDFISLSGNILCYNFSEHCSQYIFFV